VDELNAEAERLERTTQVVQLSTDARRQKVVVVVVVSAVGERR